MVVRRLPATQKQIVAILKGAKKAGVRLKITARLDEVVFTQDEENSEQPSSRREPNFDPPPRRKHKFDL